MIDKIEQLIWFGATVDYDEDDIYIFPKFWRKGSFLYIHQKFQGDELTLFLASQGDEFVICKTDESFELITEKIALLNTQVRNHNEDSSVSYF
jgi:hypothetical protein